MTAAERRGEIVSILARGLGLGRRIPWDEDRGPSAGVDQSDELLEMCSGHGKSWLCASASRV